MIGILDSVSIELLTSSLTVAADNGATVLQVDSVLDFDETGLLNLGGTELAYLSVDEDADTITLATALIDDFGEGVQVQALEVTGEIQQRWLAFVQLDPEEGAPAVPVHTSLIPYLREGLSQRGIRVEVDLDLWIVTAFPDMKPASDETTPFFQDLHLVTAVGEQTVYLTFVPVENSEHVYWLPKGGAGLYQPGSEWSRSENVVTIPDDDGIITVDDAIVVEYAYHLAAAPVSPPEPPPEPELETLIVPNDETVLRRDDADGVIVGGSPQWGDTSDATYADLDSQYGTLIRNKFQGGQTLIEAQPALVPDPTARIAVWWKETANTHPYGTDAWLSQSIGTQYMATSSPTGANGLTAPAGWLVVELVPYGTETIESIMEFWQTDDLYLNIQAADVSPTDPVGSFTSSIRITEARVAFYLPA